ncbi:Hypothetical predicted protein [Pelobates cultripes]|uniref:Uncharacterized protein n=1 Tax=Pelobates cultripes TaxID=61616 RepID=A0AAD1TED5_PELCU|nr:Hypothetical predicted protein [Pelobates cultripes]
MANTKQKKTDRKKRTDTAVLRPEHRRLRPQASQTKTKMATAGPLQSSPGPQNLPVTQDFLQNCLEDMSSKILVSIPSTLRELRRDVQELGDRTAHVEQKMEDQAAAHNDMTEQVRHMQQQLEYTQRKRGRTRPHKPDCHQNGKEPKNELTRHYKDCDAEPNAVPAADGQ